MMGRRSLIVISVLALAAGLLSTQTKAATGSGAFSLAPGESRSVIIGGPYGYIRLCNDVGSVGILEAVIGDHDPVTLAPGICYDRDSGSRIALYNLSSGRVTGIYQPEAARPLCRGG